MTGAPIVFALDEDLALNRARVASVASMYIRRAEESDLIMEMVARPAIDSRDAFGDELGWSAFGAEEDPAALPPGKASDAEIGLLIRSPYLLLRAGLRRLTVTLQFDRRAPLKESVARYVAVMRRDMEGPAARIVSDEQIVSQAFRLTLQDTGHDREIAAELDLSKLSDQQIGFVATFVPDAPPLAPGPPSTGSTAETRLPALRITINAASNARVFAYSFFEGLELTAVLLDVAVKGLAGLKAETSAGLIDASKPFFPFGPLAPQGAAVIFSHPDLYGKAIDGLTLHLEWSGLPTPPDSLESVYAAYGGQLNDESFRASLSLMSNSVWTPLPLSSAGPDVPPTFALFDGDANGLIKSSSRSFRVDASKAYAPLDQAAKPYGPTSTAGFLRLQLTDPPIGFGQRVYPELLTSTVLANAATSDREQKPTPRAPVNPEITALSLDFTARHILDLRGSSAAPDPAKDEGVYRFGPFGVRTGNIDAAFPLWPHDTGYLLIGIDGLDGSGDSTLLFFIEARALDFVTVIKDCTTQYHGRPPLTLRFFSGSDWKDMPAPTRDTTEGLTRSGIIRFQFPSDASPFPASAGSNLTWVQISVTHPERCGRFMDIRCHGTTATRISPLGAKGGLPTAMAKSINALVQKNAKILSVNQPFPTEGGRLSEDERRFQIRVSERLRHKQRAILPRDYELIILEKFPSVGDAKCLTHDEAKGFGVKPSELVIVVAPLRRAGADDQEPRVPEYLLHDIGTYLLDRCPASVGKITVRNPEYEHVRISAWLDFAPGDRGYFLECIRRNADDFLAPWRNDPAAPLAIGLGKVTLAGLHALLKGPNFVRDVKGLSVAQFYRDPSPQSPSASRLRAFFRVFDTAALRTDAQRNLIAPWWPWSVLSPASDHQFKLARGLTGIGFMGVEDSFGVASIEGDTHLPPERAGIGNMQVGVDLLVQAGIGNLAIGDDFPVG